MKAERDEDETIDFATISRKYFTNSTSDFVQTRLCFNYLLFQLEIDICLLSVRIMDRTGFACRRVKLQLFYYCWKFEFPKAETTVCLIKLLRHFDRGTLIICPNTLNVSHSAKIFWALLNFSHLIKNIQINFSLHSSSRIFIK